MKTKTSLILIGIIVLTIAMATSLSFANGTGASSSANYVSDLQNKQDSVTSIKEDSINIERELLRKLDETGVVRSPRGEYSQLHISGKDLMELMPLTGKVDLTAGKALGALQPQEDQGKK